MTETVQNPQEFLPLTPAVFNILLSLADGEKHGYAIMQEVESNTAGQVKMGRRHAACVDQVGYAACFHGSALEPVDDQLADRRRAVAIYGQRTVKNHVSQGQPAQIGA